jgi:acyl-CoA thioesterase
MPYEFDEDTAVDRIAPGRLRGTLTDRWNVGTVPNGGYVLAVGMAALEQCVPQPDPITVTAHYLGPAVPGGVEIAVELLKTGRRFCNATASMRQNNREIVRLLATYGDLTKMEGPTHIATVPPQVPAADAPGRQRTPPFHVEVRHRFALGLAEPVDEAGKAAALESGWIRFADGRPMDVHCLGLIADAFPPAVFNVTERGWVPTLELTVHFRARPRSDTLHCAFRTRFLFGGLLEEDGEMWDETGTLVAQSRQLAAAPRLRP